MRRHTRPAIALFAVAALGACGGGNSSVGASVPDAPARAPGGVVADVEPTPAPAAGPLTQGLSASAGLAPAVRAQVDALLPAVPAPLDEGQQEAVLRLAAVLALAGDDAALAALRNRVSGRMGEGPRGEAFARLPAGAAMR